MTGFQKFIKYAAIAFGIYLSITIVLVLLGIARGFVKSSQIEFGGSFGKNIEEYHPKDIDQTFENINRLKLDLEVTELIVKKGNSLKVEGKNIPDNFKIAQDGNTLKISDEKLPSSFFNENIILTIYLPETQKLEAVELELDYVSADIEMLNTTNLKLNVQYGTCKIDELIAYNMEIDSEYGEIDMYHAETKKLLLDSELGTENINVKVVENAKIDLEFTDTNIKFIGKQEEYQIQSRTQFGNTYIAGTEVTSRDETGNGNIKINLEANNSQTNIEFEEVDNESYL